MIKKYFFLFSLLISSLSFNAQQSPDSLDLSKKMLIGVTPTPPFVMEENGEYHPDWMMPDGSIISELKGK